MWLESHQKNITFKNKYDDNPTHKTAQLLLQPRNFKRFKECPKKNNEAYDDDTNATHQANTRGGRSNA